LGALGNAHILKSLCHDDRLDIAHLRLPVQLLHFLLSRDPPLFSIAANLVSASDGFVQISACACCAYFSIFEVSDFDFLSKVPVMIEGKDRAREFIESFHLLFFSGFCVSRAAAE
jgi:hypothetical protein